MQVQQIALAQQHWAELGAISYSYRLEVGGAFGSGVYRVKVNHGHCTSRHIGGIGLGAAHFRDHFRTEPSCQGRLIFDLTSQVRQDIQAGYELQDAQLNNKYGFLTRAYLDTSELFDQGWGFEVMDFKLMNANH